MRQAITTKYLGPTNYYGARVKAYSSSSTVTVPWDHSLDADQNHNRAASELIRVLSWNIGCVNDVAVVYGGYLPDGSGNVYIIDPGYCSFSVEEAKDEVSLPSRPTTGSDNHSGGQFDS